MAVGGSSTESPSAAARRFQMRLIELAREGTFGKLKTRHEGLRKGLTHLLTLLDNPEVPVLVYGERGSGKRALVNELHSMHKLYRRLEGRAEGAIKVFRGDFVTPGFTQLLTAPRAAESDVLYVENIHQMSLECQTEFLDYLKRRKHFSDKGLPQPRLVVGTEQALSVMIICGEFNRDLFKALSGFAVFIPTLKERPEDLPGVIQAFAQEATGRTQTPPSWFVDFVARREWESNFDELQQLLRQGLAKNADLSTWTERDLPPAYQSRYPEQRFEKLADDRRTRYLSALASSAGDKRRAASMLGVNYSEFLQELMVQGVR